MRGLSICPLVQVVITFFLSRQSIQLTSAESYLSASPVRVLAATLAASETDSQHTQNLKCKDGPLLTRRGCSIILQITLSNSVTCPYSVTLSFTPVHGPRERSSTFRASGHGKNLPSMWLSIDLPPSFPVGYYDAHISLSIHGCTEVVTHMMHYAIVVLFNPWIKGMVVLQLQCNATVIRVTVILMKLYR